MQPTLPTVKIAAFEGPFELLLDLARKRKLDLTQVSLKQITDDFLGYLNAHSIPTDVQGDFLVVAATLLLLKVQHLLPSLTPEEEEEVEALTDRLRVYQLFRTQAEYLGHNWGRRRLLTYAFWRDPDATDLRPESWPRVSASEMFEYFARLMDRLPKPLYPRAHLTTQGRSLKECLAHFHERLLLVNKFIFQEAVMGVSQKEAAVSFLAVLQMGRTGQYALEQSELFGALTVTRAPKGNEIENRK